MMAGCYTFSAEAEYPRIEHRPGNDIRFNTEVRYVISVGGDVLAELVQNRFYMYLKIQKNREKIADGLVGSVLLFADGKVIVTLNFRDEPIVSTLDEIIPATNTCSDMPEAGSAGYPRSSTAHRAVLLCFFSYLTTLR